MDILGFEVWHSSSNIEGEMRETREKDSGEFKLDLSRWREGGYRPDIVDACGQTGLLTLIQGGAFKDKLKHLRKNNIENKDSLV